MIVQSRNVSCVGGRSGKKATPQNYPRILTVCTTQQQWFEHGVEVKINAKFELMTVPLIGYYCTTRTDRDGEEAVEKYPPPTRHRKKNK